MSCCKCFKVPCCCTKTVTNTIKYTPVIKNENSFLMPECDAVVNVDITKVDALLVGANLWSPTFGYLEIISYNPTTGIVTLKNNCVVGNADPQTPIPEDSEFIMTPINSSAPANFTLEVGEGCEAPGANNMISELDYTGGVLTIKGNPAYSANASGSNISLVPFTPGEDFTINPDESATTTPIPLSVEPQVLCRYAYYFCTVDLTFLLTNPGSNGDDYTVTLERQIGVGAWEPIQIVTTWLPGGFLPPKSPFNMHRSWIDAFDPNDGPFTMNIRAKFEISAANPDPVVIEKALVTASLLSISNEGTP